MSRYVAIKVSEDMISTEETVRYCITPKMIEDSPNFDTEEEASRYCDLINPDFLWVIMPLNTEENE